MIPGSLAARQEEEALILGQAMVEAELAREDAHRFFEFVMREENTKRALVEMPHQRVLLDFILAHPVCSIALPPGGAKCHGKGTPILMAGGSTRPVEEVRTGDRVMGPSGPRKVLTTAQGRERMYRISPVKGEAFVVNEAHVLTLVNTDTGRVIDISLGDYLRRSAWFQERHKLFHVPVKKFDGEASLDVDAYFLGVWFGDGLHWTKSLIITNIDPQVRAACAVEADKHGLKVVERDEQSFALSRPGGKGAGLGLPMHSGNPLMNAIKRTVGEGLSMEKLKTASWEDRASFLAGFIDADGSNHNNCVTIAQKRRDWAEAVAFIARSLGIMVTERRWEHPVYGGYTTLSLYGDMTHIPIRIPRKKMKPRRQRKNALRSGFTVEPLGEGDYYGFSIGGDGRYLLGDFTVTHNTFTCAALVMYLLGLDPTVRGLIISASQEQAMKPLRMVKDYIEGEPSLRMVFPHLRKSPRRADPWTQTEITVDRPRGIRDASLVARGFDGNVAGSRLRFIFCDDLLNDENTRTPDARAKTAMLVDGTLHTRLDPGTGVRPGDPSSVPRLVFVNTVYHPDDEIHRQERNGTPTLRMAIDGTITITNTDWDSDDLRPSSMSPLDATCRLAAHDPDPGNRLGLWPSKWTPEWVEEKRRTTLPIYFNRNFMAQARSDDDAMCKREYVERCLAEARKRGVHRMLTRYEGSLPVFGGLDLAFSEDSASDLVAFFAFCVHPDGMKQLLWVSEGRWPGPEVSTMLIDAHDRFGGVWSVESNAAQKYMVQFTREADKRVPLRAHNTGKEKMSAEWGLPGIFTEMMGGTWLLPNDERGRVEPMVQRFIDGCLYYRPTKHAADTLMACHFAHHAALRLGALRRPAKPGAGGKSVGSLMAR